MAETTTKDAPFGAGAGAAFVSAAAAESNDALAAGMKEDWRQISAAQARFIVRLAESNKREMFRDDGATSPEAWVAECFGTSVPTARSLSLVADKAPELPHLVGSLGEGDISFDKVRAVVDVATRATDRELCGQAKERSVRELVEVARDAAERARSASASPARSEHDGRYLRFNDGHRTMSLQLPTEEYARTKACVDAWTGALPSDEQAPLDQRRSDGFMGIVDSATPGAGGGAGGGGGRRRGTIGSGHGAQPVLRGGPRPSRGPGARVGRDE